MVMETLYTQEYLQEESFRTYQSHKNKIKVETEKAQDKSYSNSYLSSLLLLEFIFKTQVRYGEQAASIYKHYTKLGTPLAEIIENIKENYALYQKRKQDELITQVENHKLLFGLIDLPNVPKTMIRQSKDGNFVEKHTYVYDTSKALKNIFTKNEESPVSVHVEVEEEFSLGELPYDFSDTKNIFDFLMNRKVVFEYLLSDTDIMNIDTSDVNDLTKTFYTIHGTDSDREQLELQIKEQEDIQTNITSDEIEGDSKNITFEKVENNLPIIEKEVPKIEWLGTSKQLYDLFLVLCQKNWIEDLNFDLIEKYFTQSDNIRQIELKNSTTFKDIKTNPKLEASAEIGKISWLGTQKI